MTRSEFLGIQYPNSPYFVFSRGHSTRFNESVHVKNTNTDKQLNFWYRNDDTVTVCLFDGNENNPWKTHNNIIQNDKRFTEEKAHTAIRMYLESTIADGEGHE